MADIRIGDELQRRFLVHMLRVRMFEEKIDELYLQGKLPGSIHTSIGQEAVSVGVLNAMREDDLAIGSHRCHGYWVIKGMDVKGMFAELYGKRTGSCKGKAGSMHLIDVTKGVMGAIGIVGQQMPMAAGIGLALKMNGSDRICLCFFGDGASNTGVFHEALNVASLWKLPVIFVCENNGYAVSVPVHRSTSVKDIAQRGQSYNIPGEVVDGMDVLAVYPVAQKAAERARKGEGPSLIECKTYRFLGHSRGDPPYGPYRTKEELESWKEKDPIKKLIADLAIPEDEAARIRKQISEEYEAAVRFAEESPYPASHEALEDIFV
jgi:pyruvate dehydrogenase E1 component alpha subunit